jgi:hypothetical protein
MNLSPGTRLLAIAAAGALCLAGCEARPDPGPDAPAGAVGTVEIEKAGELQKPVVPAGAGGRAGQTPVYGQPGGAPSMVYSGPGAPSPDAGKPPAPE